MEYYIAQVHEVDCFHPMRGTVQNLMVDFLHKTRVLFFIDSPNRYIFTESDKNTYFRYDYK